MENSKETNNEVKDLQLIITLKPDGNVSISGPIANKPISLYMLEVAKDLIKVYNPNKITPSGGILNFARKRF